MAPSIDVSTGFDKIPDARTVARGAVFLEGPQGLLISWFLIGAFVILTSSIGLIGTLLLLPLVFFMLGIGVLWLLVDMRR